MLMILNNGKEFNVSGIIDIGYLEITFEEGVTYDEVAKVYDKTYAPLEFSEEALRKFDLYSEGELQGTHLGYTEPRSISAFNNIVTVRVEKENELKTEVELIKAENARLKEMVDMLVSVSTLKL